PSPATAATPSRPFAMKNSRPSLMPPTRPATRAASARACSLSAVSTAQNTGFVIAARWAAGPDPSWRGVTVEDQGAGDLGQKLQAALRAHADGPVAVIGTDTPDVTPARIAGAFAATRGGRAVLGAAEDGGFWLLAVPQARARTVDLSGIRWSSPETLADTEAALGGAMTKLETLADIDTGEDLARWRQAQRSARISTIRS
ncbi:MAG: DUF2064 domain-containing protein, partial [Alphaproteobacteria bacterium]|nr:DUF2064 domain-containing protein [Alphaproteobacteria bacterium]